VADAGVSWGTFFRYFPPKEDVLLAAMAEHYRTRVRRWPLHLHGAILRVTSTPVRVAALLGPEEKPWFAVVAELMAARRVRADIDPLTLPAVVAAGSLFPRHPGRLRGSARPVRPARDRRRHRHPRPRLSRRLAGRRGGLVGHAAALAAAAARVVRAPAAIAAAWNASPVARSAVVNATCTPLSGRARACRPEKRKVVAESTHVGDPAATGTRWCPFVARRIRGRRRSPWLIPPNMSPDSDKAVLSDSAVGPA